jgi:hypothetical protein
MLRNARSYDRIHARREARLPRMRTTTCFVRTFAKDVRPR